MPTHSVKAKYFFNWTLKLIRNYSLTNWSSMFFKLCFMYENLKCLACIHQTSVGIKRFALHCKQTVVYYDHFVFIIKRSFKVCHVAKI